MIRRLHRTRRRLHRSPETRKHGFQASDPQVVRHVVDPEQQPESLEDVESVVVARGRHGSAGAAAGERRTDGGIRGARRIRKGIRDGRVHQRRLQRRHHPGQRAVAQNLPPHGFDEPAEEVTRASAHLARTVRHPSAVQKRRQRRSKQLLRSPLHREVVPYANLEQRGRDEPVRRNLWRLGTQDVPRPQEHLHQLAQRRFLHPGLHRPVVRALADEVQRPERRLHRLPPNGLVAAADTFERPGQRAPHRAQRQVGRQPRDGPEQHRQLLPHRHGVRLALPRRLIVPC